LNPTIWLNIDRVLINNISVISSQSVLLLGVPGKKHWPAASHWQTLSHNVISSLSRIQTHNISVDLRIPSLHHLLISELALNNNHSLTHFSGILFYLFQVHLYLLRRNIYYRVQCQNKSLDILFGFLRGQSWSWSYGSWIYNYLCNQWQSPLKLWVWIPFRWGVLNTTL
jgi:hypothetical protein